MKVRNFIGAIIAIAMLATGVGLLTPKKSPQQEALISLAEAAGYEVSALPGYNGAWWVTVEVPGCKNRVGLRSEEAPRDRVPTRYFVVRVGSVSQEALRS